MVPARTCYYYGGTPPALTTARLFNAPFDVQCRNGSLPELLMIVLIYRSDQDEDEDKDRNKDEDNNHLHQSGHTVPMMTAVALVNEGDLVRTRI